MLKACASLTPVLLLLFPGVPCQASEHPLPASACPQLFGGPAAHDQNEHFRHEHLDSVNEADYTINLTHSADWESPERIRFKGLKLVDTRVGDKRGQVALIEVDPSVGSVDCDPGLYRLRVDDSIGKRSRVLAVLDDVVLVARGDELNYLKTPDAEAPVFRMIWRAPWKITILPGGTGSSAPTRRAGTKRTHRPSSVSRRTHGRR